MAMANNLPFTGFNTSLDFKLPEDSPAFGQTIYVAGRSVGPGYFGALGIAFKDRRDFGSREPNPADRACESSTKRWRTCYGPMAGRPAGC